MVGDADPAMMEELIRARFGGWRAEGPAPAEPDYGGIAEVPTAGRQPRLSRRPDRRQPASGCGPMRRCRTRMARERQFLEEMLAAQIINRRLEAHARGQSAFLGAGDRRRADRAASPTATQLVALRARRQLARRR